MTTYTFTENRECFLAQKRHQVEKTWRASTPTVAQTLVLIGETTGEKNGLRGFRPLIVVPET